MATFAPSAARRLAIAAPIPREPPVTNAIFPSSLVGIVSSPFPSISLFADPVAYVRRTVKQSGALCFTHPQEADCFNIDQVQFLQIQHDLRFALRYLLLQLG